MKKQFSLRFQITSILLAFIVLVLGLIYLFQTVFLDDFYYRNKIKDVMRISNALVRNIENDDIDAMIAETSFSNEVCVRIDFDSSSITSSNPSSVCALDHLSQKQVETIAARTVQSGGKKLFSDFHLSYPYDNKELFIYGQMALYKDEPILVMVSSSVEPLNATISTVRSQYIMIASIIVVVTIILSFIISKMIITPIKRLNVESKNLPEGRFDDTKCQASTLEFSDLNHTLSTANDEINKADMARKELLSNVSHDLRTPLTMIVGYGEMIRDIEEENNEENINVIIDEAKRLSSLVDDLLDVSHLESGQLELHRSEISLNTFLTKVYHQYQKYCESLNVTFTLKLDEDITVSFDTKRIGQVLYNFLNNALNYNDNENKVIELRSEKVGNRYKISVYDNGKGIKEEDLPKIWDRYYKVDREHRRHRIGSGIGLSLAKELLALHDFEFGVESKFGEYSIFYFYIDKAAE